MPTLVGGRRPIPPKICAQSDPPPFDHNDFDQYPLIVPQRWELAKNVQLALIGSRPHAFQQAIDEPYTLPLSPPQGGTKRDFVVFASKSQLLLKESVAKFLLWNFQRRSYSYIIPLSNSP